MRFLLGPPDNFLQFSLLKNCPEELLLEEADSLKQIHSSKAVKDFIYYTVSGVNPVLLALWATQPSQKVVNSALKKSLPPYSEETLMTIGS